MKSARFNIYSMQLAPSQTNQSHGPMMIPATMANIVNPRILRVPFVMEDVTAVTVDDYGRLGARQFLVELVRRVELVSEYVLCCTFLYTGIDFTVLTRQREHVMHSGSSGVEKLIVVSAE